MELIPLFVQTRGTAASCICSGMHANVLVYSSDGYSMCSLFRNRTVMSDPQQRRVSIDVDCYWACLGILRARVLGGLGDVAVAPSDFARRLCLIADTGDANASSAAVTAFSMP